MPYLPSIHATVVDPIKKTLCPYCFERIDLGLCPTVDIDDPDTVIESAPTGVRGILRKMVVPQRYGVENLNARRQCTECKNLLPQNMECMEQQFIGLIGAQASGKSHYIASLIKELKDDSILDDLGLVEISPADERYSKQYREKYYKPLFKEHQAIEPTRSKKVSGEPIEPLVYNLVFRPRVDAKSTRRLTLLLFDAAGEDMEEQRDIAIVTRYIHNSSALILMVDPLSIGPMARKIPQTFHLETLPEIDGYETLWNVVDILRKKLGGLPGDKVDMPIAIAVAKSDLLRYVTHPGIPQFLQPPKYWSGSDPGQLQQVDEEVRTLLEEHGGRNILTQSKAFRNAAFFAISATGTPARTNSTYPEVKPLRCSDPLVWILQKMGVIDPSTPESRD